jgi:hypothetical protein
VPRSWSLVWFAQSHLDPPEETDSEWRERWADEAERYDQSPPPVLWLDPEDFVRTEPAELAEANAKTAERALAGALEHLEDRK